MQAQDLRIGNWVNHKADIVKVWSLSQEWLRVENEYSKAVSYDNISGIPITPNILEKAGFMITNEDYYFQQHIWVNENGFKIAVCDIEFSVRIPHEKCGVLNRCYFLHQLQNLTYIVSGQELILTL